jgi:hypothetical protein
MPTCFCSNPIYMESQDVRVSAFWVRKTAVVTKNFNYLKIKIIAVFNDIMFTQSRKCRIVVQDNELKTKVMEYQAKGASEWRVKFRRRFRVRIYNQY